MIYTIGYDKTTLAEVEAIIVEKGIDLLVDVRSIPYSRRKDKQEFNKNRLIAKMGDHYTWLGAILGGKNGSATKEGIEKLISLTATPCERVLLIFCLEDDPRQCHRLYDIGARLLTAGIDTINIYKGEEIKASALLAKKRGDEHHVTSG